jgi:predicted Zn-dependent peptidase
MEGDTMAKISAALALGAALALPARGADGEQAIDLGAREVVLENGLRVIAVERPRSSREALWLFYGVGSACETPGTTGISHLIEHLMFKGTRRIGVRDEAATERLAADVEAAFSALKEAEASGDAARCAEAAARFDQARRRERQNSIQDELWDLYLASGGTDLNAYTTEDLTAYMVTLPASRVELFMWLEADRMKNAVFREFYAERDVVREERRLDENKPDGPFYEELTGLAFLAHPYRWPVVGFMSDLEGITPEDCVRYFRTYYRPDNAVLVAVGGAPREEVERLARRYFGPIPRGAAPVPPVRAKEPEPAGERRLFVEAEARPRATLVFTTPGAKEADVPALEVAAAVLDGRSGRLWAELVEKTEVASEARASFDERRWAGIFTAEAYARGENEPEAVAGAIQAELDRLAREGPKEEELARAKTRLMADLVKRLEEPESLAETLGQRAIMGDWREVERLPARWRAVSAADVKRVAGRWLSSKRRIVGILREPAGERADEEHGEGKGEEKEEGK